MRSLIDIYKSYNIIVVELESYETASKEEVWVMKIKEKLK
jgi:hypothetical protein